LAPGCGETSRVDMVTKAPGRDALKGQVQWFAGGASQGDHAMLEVSGGGGEGL
jgi:hypothetical protein